MASRRVEWIKTQMFIVGNGLSAVNVKPRLRAYRAKTFGSDPFLFLLEKWCTLLSLSRALARLNEAYKRRQGSPGNADQSHDIDYPHKSNETTEEMNVPFHDAFTQDCTHHQHTQLEAGGGY
jgi:hypothetical protein